MVHKVLLLEDNEADALLMVRHLQRSSFDFKIKVVTTGQAFEEAAEDYEPDIIISDYRLKQYSGIDAIRFRNLKCEEVPIIVVSGTIGEEKAAELIKEGATDFLMKNNAENRLGLAVSRAIQEAAEKKKRRQAEMASNQHQILMKELTDQTWAAIWVKDAQGRHIFINQKYKTLFGLLNRDVIGKTNFELFDEETAFRFTESDMKVLKANEPIALEEWITTNNEDRYFKTNIFPLKGVPGLSDLIGGVAMDITEQKKNEELITNSLKENEILLAEIHHRVKNNLAVVSAMLQLQAAEEKNEEISNRLFGSVGRIRAIANIHEHLYQANTFYRLNFTENIRQLATEIVEAFQIDKSIKLEFTCDPVQLNINQAIPCSLIINEVITNIHKHAFLDKKHGMIHIFLENQDDKMKLTIKDDGIGFTGNIKEIKSGSLGLQILSVLSRQLKANYDYKSTGGYNYFTLDFVKEDIKGSASSFI